MRVINTKNLWELGGILKLDLFAQCLGQAVLRTSLKSGPRCEHPHGSSTLSPAPTCPVVGSPSPCGCPTYGNLVDRYPSIPQNKSCTQLPRSTISDHITRDASSLRATHGLPRGAPHPPFTAPPRRGRCRVGCGRPRWHVHRRSFRPSDRSRRRRRWPASPRSRPWPGEC
jgi:hypothetical protein